MEEKILVLSVGKPYDIAAEDGSHITGCSMMYINADDVNVPFADADSGELGYTPVKERMPVEFYERAKAQGLPAVANVVLNRVRNSRYDNTITGVIYARSQFSGVSDGYGNASSTFQARLDAGPRTQECLEAAMEALSGVNNIGSYTSFRSVSIANYDAYSSFTIIGGHVFY